MSAQALWYSTARRSLCKSCLLSLRARAYYSQSAVSGRVRDPDLSASGSTSGRTRTAAWDDSYHALADKDPLNPTRLDRYLTSIKAADLEPTLEDVERCKPANFSRPDSPRYAAEYTDLLETLCRSFSKDQLRRFTELYQLDRIWTRSSRRKNEYAESIIEKAWGWPSLKEIERKRRDTSEVLVKSFTVTPGQLFSIMGKDGADLLQLSMQYNVHISLTSSPLSLRVEGLRGSLKGLTEHISSLKKGIIDEIYELPTSRPIRPDLLQRISRLSGAYVENHGNRGKVRICAKHVDDILAAKRLALRVSVEDGTQARTVCYEPPSKIRDSPIEIPESPSYSIYPHVAPCPFPWTMHSSSAFRLRRVADWLGVNSYEDIASTGGLANNTRRLLNFDQSVEELSQLVCSTITESAAHPQRTITAWLGHILLSSGEKSLFPPLSSTLSLSEILKWVETSNTPLNFVPSLSPGIMSYTGGKSRALQRLIYRTLPHMGHVLKFEIPDPTRTQAPQDRRDEQVEDVPSSDSNSNEDPLSFLPSSSQPDSLPEASEREFEVPICQVGREAYVNLMLPDRPMDMQFSVFDWDGVTLIQQPQVLRDYTNSLCDFMSNKAQLSRPDPPLTFNFEGRAYYLYENLSLRQCNYPSSLSTFPKDDHVDGSVEVCHESVVDLQTAQKMECCQVNFDGITEGLNWKRFLAACDQLSSIAMEQGRPRTRNLER